MLSIFPVRRESALVVLSRCFRAPAILATALATILPSTTHAAPLTAAQMTATARQIISQRMLDPSSLQMRNAKVLTLTSPQGKQVQVLCGEYNAKNRMGGYTGFKVFAYEPVEMGGVLSIDLPRRMDFFSIDGKTDLGSAEDAVKSGLPSEEISRRNQKNVDYGVKYAPACMS